MYKISIIMPVYKTEKYIHKSIETVIHQTYENIEVILVDDGSPDNCPQIIDQYQKKYAHKIKVIHKQNGGYGSAVNAGLKIATGEYIAIVETDDWLDIQMYEKLVAIADKTGADCIKCNYSEAFSPGCTRKVNFLPTLPLNKAFTLKQHPELIMNPTSIWSALYKRKMLEKANIRLVENIRPYEDMPFTCDVYANEADIVLLDEPLYYYRCEPNQNSSTIRSDKKDRILFNIHGQTIQGIEHLKMYGAWEYTKEYMYKRIFNNAKFFIGLIHPSLRREMFEGYTKIYSYIKKDTEIIHKHFLKSDLKLVKCIESGDFKRYILNPVFTYAKKHPLFVFKAKFYKILKNARQSINHQPCLNPGKK